MRFTPTTGKIESNPIIILYVCTASDSVECWRNHASVSIIYNNNLFFAAPMCIHLIEMLLLLHCVHFSFFVLSETKLYNTKIKRLKYFQS